MHPKEYTSTELLDIMLDDPYRDTILNASNHSMCDTVKNILDDDDVSPPQSMFFHDRIDN